VNRAGERTEPNYTKNCPNAVFSTAFRAFFMVVRETLAQRVGQKKHNDETGTVPVFFIAKSNQQSKEDQSFFGLLYHSALTITQRSPKRPM
jgi:hypothetical protein